MPYHDHDYGQFDLTDDRGELTLHRQSAATGDITSMPLGSCAVRVAMDILRRSGQASDTLAQAVADTLDARAAWGMPMSAREMQVIADMLRRGAGARPEAVVVAFPRRVVA